MRRCASVVLAMVVCLSVGLSVCPSHAGIVLKQLNRLSLFFGIGASLGLSFTLLEGNLCIPKNKGTSLWNVVPNSGLGKISQLHVDRHVCCQLRWTLSVINWRRSSVTSLSY